MECCCATVGIMLVLLSLSLALLISPVPSCLLGPELAFPVARKTGSSPSKRGSPAISKHRDFSHCWHCHWGQFRIYLHWFDREPENQLTCIFHYTAIIRYSEDKLMLVLAPEKMRAFVFFPSNYILCSFSTTLIFIKKWKKSYLCMFVTAS